MARQAAFGELAGGLGFAAVAALSGGIGYVISVVAAAAVFLVFLRGTKAGRRFADRRRPPAQRQLLYVSGYVIGFILLWIVASYAFGSGAFNASILAALLLAFGAVDLSTVQVESSESLQGEEAEV
jgi:hypothetical protein